MEPSKTCGVISRSQMVWGLRYIDDAMVRMLDKNLDGDCRDSGELFWQLSDAQFSVIAIVDKNAVLQERVSYTSYGVATHRWPHEVNNTGGVTTSGSTSDYGVINTLAGAHSGAGTTIDETTYNVAADLNRDGVIDSTDTSIFTTTFGGAKSALAGGLISDPNGPDNVFGYDGYVYNADQGLYTVRFRWYSPTFGRWLQRDPAGYVDGQSLMEYCGSAPIAEIDAMGLKATRHLPSPPAQFSNQHTLMALLRVWNNITCADLEMLIGGQLDTVHELIAWRHYVGGSGTDMVIPADEFSRMLQAGDEFRNALNEAKAACAKGSCGSEQKTDVLFVAPAPYKKSIGRASISVTFRCSGGCVTWDAKMDDVYDFNDDSSRGANANAATNLVAWAKKARNCRWWTPFHIKSTASGFSACPGN